MITTSFSMQVFISKASTSTLTLLPVLRTYYNSTDAVFSLVSAYFRDSYTYLD